MRNVRKVMILAVVAALLPALPALAQEAPSPSTLTWVGCWQLTGAVSGARELQQERRVCVQPQGTALAITTYENGDEVQSNLLDIGGADRPVADGGCSGTERAFLSADGGRLFSKADLTCEGGTRRRSSGISSLADTDTWVDVQVVTVDDGREVLVRRFRYLERASAELLEQAGHGDLTVAARAARTRAASALDVAAVVEATAAVDTAAVEAWLMETDAAFELDGASLVALADSGVPGGVIDVMVALSFPDYFMVDANVESYTGRNYPRYRNAFFGYGAFAPYGWGYSGRYGYGYGYYPGYPGYPGIPGYPGTGIRGGKVVAGQGYARVQTNPKAPSGGFTKFIRDGGRSVGRSAGAGGGSNGGGGSATSSGPTRGGSGSSSGRTAKRRGGDGY